MTTPNITYQRTYSQFSNSVITTKINPVYSECLLSDANGLDIVVVDNFANTFPPDAGIAALCISHTVNARTTGGTSVRHDVDLQSTLVSNFNVSHTQITHSKRIDGGVADALWWNSFSPNSNFSTKPDAAGIVHKFDKGWSRIGELNYGNAWGDFGFLSDRSGPSHVVCGLEFFPDWVSGTDGDTQYAKYHASWAIAIGSGGPGITGKEAKHWIGILGSLNGIVGKNDHAKMLPGAVTGNTSGGGGYWAQINGSLDPTNPIGKAMNLTHAMDVGIDMREANFTEAAMMLNDDQPIKLGSVWLRGHQGHVQVSADSVNWRNL